MADIHISLDCVAASDIAALGIPPDAAERLHGRIAEIILIYGPATPDTWRQISTRVLSPDLPFAFHRMLYYACFNGFGDDPPAWIPDP